MGIIENVNLGEGMKGMSISSISAGAVAVTSFVIYSTTQNILVFFIGIILSILFLGYDYVNNKKWQQHDKQRRERICTTIEKLAPYVAQVLSSNEDTEQKLIEQAKKELEHLS